MKERMKRRGEVAADEGGEGGRDDGPSFRDPTSRRGVLIGIQIVPGL
jgi:hypothetical protein